MSITRKVLEIIGVIVAIPSLVILYLFINPSLPGFSTRSLVIFITSFIVVLGVIILINLVRTLTKLYNTLLVIAKGDINRKAEVETSSGAGGLAISINQVSQRLRESADELEKRSILIERHTQEFNRTKRLKLDYPSDIVHELRAPTINIDKSTAILLGGELGKPNTEQENFLRIINNNAKRLNHLIDDLLDVSKMESGRPQTKYELFFVKDVIEDAVNSVNNWRQSKNLRLETKIWDKLLKVYADREKIVQVIVNLLSNAIKFTPPGGEILVGGRCSEQHVNTALSGSSDLFIEILVQDSGIGIPASRKDSIFERYNAGEDVSFNTIPSTGLGLSIAKQIIEMHGGRIWVESQPGKGSRFTFIIPQGLSKSKTLGQKPSKKILIIDDEDNVRELLGRELDKNGYFVTMVRDGLEGIKEALGCYYDLVITDIRMPNIDGIDCIKILKKIKPQLFFIVITGFPIEQDLEEILKGGAYPCIKKPFDLENLLKTVEEAQPALLEN